MAGRPAECVFWEKMHKGIPDVEILDKLLVNGAMLLTRDRVLHNRACAQGVRSFTLNELGQMQSKRLPGIALPKGKPAPSVLKELKEDYTSKVSELTLKLTNGMPERDLKFYRTRRRRIRSYFGSTANLGTVAMTIDAERVGNKVLCGYVIRIDGLAGVKQLRASEGYSAINVRSYDPTHAVLSALIASFHLHLDQIPTELYIISKEALEISQALNRAEPEQLTRPCRYALREMLQHIPHLKLSPCIKGRFFDEMKNKLSRLSDFRSNELQNITLDQMVEKTLGDLTEIPGTNTDAQIPGR